MPTGEAVALARALAPEREDPGGPGDRGPDRPAGCRGGGVASILLHDPEEGEAVGEDALNLTRVEDVR